MATAGGRLSTFECRICFMPFSRQTRAPFMFACCEFLLCTECLSQLEISNNSANCPQCRQLTPCHLITKSRMVLRFLSTTCSSCSKLFENELVECQYCEKFLCTTCNGIHHHREEQAKQFKTILKQIFEKSKTDLSYDVSLCIDKVINKLSVLKSNMEMESLRVGISGQTICVKNKLQQLENSSTLKDQDFFGMNELKASYTNNTLRFWHDANIKSRSCTDQAEEIIRILVDLFPMVDLQSVTRSKSNTKSAPQEASKKAKNELISPKVQKPQESTPSSEKQKKAKSSEAKQKKQVSKRDNQANNSKEDVKCSDSLDEIPKSAKIEKSQKQKKVKSSEAKQKIQVADTEKQASNSNAGGKCSGSLDEFRSSFSNLRIISKYNFTHIYLHHLISMYETEFFAALCEGQSRKFYINVYDLRFIPQMSMEITIDSFERFISVCFCSSTKAFVCLVMNPMITNLCKVYHVSEQSSTILFTFPEVIFDVASTSNGIFYLSNNCLYRDVVSNVAYTFKSILLFGRLVVTINSNIGCLRKERNAFVFYLFDFSKGKDCLVNATIVDISPIPLGIKMMFIRAKLLDAYILAEIFGTRTKLFLLDGRGKLLSSAHLSSSFALGLCVGEKILLSSSGVGVHFFEAAGQNS